MNYSTSSKGRIWVGLGPQEGPSKAPVALPSEFSGLSGNILGLSWVTLTLFDRANEALGGSWHPKSAIDLNDLSSNRDLEDVRHEGRVFTWNDGRDPTTRIFRKLDRVVANGQWFDCFRRSKAVFSQARLSDHSPCILLSEGWVSRGHGIFRFNNFLTKSPNFLPLVKETWGTEIPGTPMFKLVSLLKKVKSVLKNLNTQCGDVHEEAEYYSPWLRRRISSTKKPRSNGLKRATKGTNFFFKTVSGNYNRNRITSLLDESGIPTNGTEDLHKLIEGHFVNALGSGGPMGRRRLTGSARTFSIQAPGPMDLPQNSLRIRGRSWSYLVYEAVHDFFKHGKLLNLGALHKYHLGTWPARMYYEDRHEESLRLCLLGFRYQYPHPNGIPSTNGKLDWRCISTPTYSLNINGEAVGFFKGGKGCVKEIDRILRHFLRTVFDGRANAKVAWHDICCPKDEGGLGIKNPIDQNKALNRKFLWRLLSKDPTSLGLHGYTKTESKTGASRDHQSARLGPLELAQNYEALAFMRAYFVKDIGGL
ncbi:hypothetical protein Nepgr_020427 [Nepenthes gracilis]|uniref:Uncharacterized protein n=1 Tax=Nepenthes gracilis TaxID=150966 RepID=A0AAD3XWC8_NEPGR|nr:hypothetical protein Nepgr_020427 [Nepenthes gracilis]